MKKSNIPSAESLRKIERVLSDAVETGIMTPEAAARRKEELYQNILKEYQEKYYRLEKRNLWAVKVPCATAKDGRKMFQARTKELLDEKLKNYFLNETDKEEYLFETVFKKFLEQAKNERAAGTVHRYSVDWNRYFADSDLPKTDIRTITVGGLKKTFIAIAKQHNVTKRQYRDFKTLANKIFDFAVENELVDRNPSVLIRDLGRNINVVSPDNEKDDLEEIFTNEEVGRLIETAVQMFKRWNNTAYLGIILNLELGLRVGEIVALKFDDFDPETRTLTLSRSERESFDNDGKKNGYKLLDSLKGGYGKSTVAFSKDAWEILSIIREANLEKIGPSEWVFLNTEGDRMHANSMENALRRLCDKAGIPRKSFHKLRKPYASVLNEKAFTILEIQKQLRHKDPSTTTRFYIRDRSGKSAIVDKVNATLADPRMEKAIEALNMAV